MEKSKSGMMLSSSLWVGAVSASESWGANGHTARYSSLVTVVWQCKAGVWLTAMETEISAAPWALWLGKDLTLAHIISYHNVNF